MRGSSASSLGAFRQRSLHAGLHREYRLQSRHVGSTGGGLPYGPAALRRTAQLTQTCIRLEVPWETSFYQCAHSPCLQRPCWRDAGALITTPASIHSVSDTGQDIVNQNASDGGIEQCQGNGTSKGWIWTFEPVEGSCSALKDLFGMAYPSQAKNSIQLHGIQRLLSCLVTS